MKRLTFTLVAPLLTTLAAPGARAQQALKTPVHLSDFKGKTVVLAFFYKARTKG